MRRKHTQDRAEITQEIRKVALIFQVPHGGIPEAGHSPFSFTQEGFAYKKPQQRCPGTTQRHRTRKKKRERYKDRKMRKPKTEMIQVFLTGNR